MIKNKVILPIVFFLSSVFAFNGCATYYNTIEYEKKKLKENTVELAQQVLDFGTDIPDSSSSTKTTHATVIGNPRRLEARLYDNAPYCEGNAVNLGVEDSLKITSIFTETLAPDAMYIETKFDGLGDGDVLRYYTDKYLYTVNVTETDIDSVVYFPAALVIQSKNALLLRYGKKNIVEFEVTDSSILNPGYFANYVFSDAGSTMDLMFDSQTYQYRRNFRDLLSYQFLIKYFDNTPNFLPDGPSRNDILELYYVDNNICVNFLHFGGDKFSYGDKLIIMAPDGRITKMILDDDTKDEFLKKYNTFTKYMTERFIENNE